MRSGKLVLCAGLVALLTACSGGDDNADKSNSGGDKKTDSPAADSSSGSSGAKNFDDFPGESLVYTEGGFKIGVKVKAIDSTWKAEVLDKPADPGKHFLAVWIVVTPELPDRGTDKVSISKRFHVRYKATDGKCDPKTPAKQSGYCYEWGWPGSSLVPRVDSNWREGSWIQSEYTRDDVKKGQTLYGLVGFQIDDSVKTTEFEFCAPSKEQSSNEEKFPCMPVKTPDGSR
ncbi:hypothetical protein ALI144C_19805 [Actinosynnema sp. ALI-1.44]|uniref:hypothetical protein n=1 Tax=Actinosynnema sp. ALI-1.44 TaxID=1933779 RepID=UPI00097BD34B|nr:hypothetical protein [Actinosynnema sp. ALI-1.44]ONI81561.1 hypothetical protein ALI144C_19805 [Actinosynnema sp. ALI-1.44]